MQATAAYVQRTFLQQASFEAGCAGSMAESHLSKDSCQESSDTPESDSSMRLLLAMPSTRTSVSMFSRSSCGGRLGSEWASRYAGGEGASKHVTSGNLALSMDASCGHVTPWTCHYKISRAYRTQQVLHAGQVPNERR